MPFAKVNPPRSENGSIHPAEHLANLVYHQQCCDLHNLRNNDADMAVRCLTDSLAVRSVRYVVLSVSALALFLVIWTYHRHSSTTDHPLSSMSRPSPSISAATRESLQDVQNATLGVCHVFRFPRCYMPADRSGSFSRSSPSIFPSVRITGTDWSLPLLFPISLSSSSKACTAALYPSKLYLVFISMTFLPA